MTIDYACMAQLPDIRIFQVSTAVQKKNQNYLDKFFSSQHFGRVLDSTKGKRLFDDQKKTDAKK